MNRGSAVASSSTAVSRREIYVKPFVEMPQRALEAWKPKHVEPITDWVTKNIFFDGKTSAVPGPWDHHAFPYSKAVLQAFDDPKIRGIVLPWGTRLGKTTIITGVLGSNAAQDPCPMMIGHPDADSAKEYVGTKLIPMIEKIASLKHKIPPPTKRNFNYLDLGESIIYQAWSGARRTVSGRSARVLCITEANLWTTDESQEGDPVEMALDRLKDFADAKWIVEGKPTTDGQCRVYKFYNMSDKRRYHVPCPLCGHFQPLDLGTKHSDHGLKFKTRDNGTVDESTVFYQCFKCYGKFDHNHKFKMNLRGVWCAEGQVVEKNGELQGLPVNNTNIAGFQLSSLYSRVLTWYECAEKFVQASRNGQDALKNYVQGWLAETWKVEARRVHDDELEPHMLDYELGTVPGDAALLVLAADVQLDHLWYVIRAYGAWGQSWLVRYGRIDTIDAIDGLVLNQFYRGRNNEAYPINLVMVDIADGNKKAEVFEYCLQRQPWAVPVRGVKQYQQAALVHVSSIQHAGAEIPMWTIDAGHSRDNFYDRRLRITQGSPGFFAFSKHVGGEYLQGLLAWEREEKENKRTGLNESRWKSKSKRFEHLGDCENMCEAAAVHYGMPHYEGSVVENYAKALPRLQPKIPTAIPAGEKPPEPQSVGAEQLVQSQIKREVNRDNQVRRSDGRGWWD